MVELGVADTRTTLRRGCLAIKSAITIFFKRWHKNAQHVVIKMREEKIKQRVSCNEMGQTFSPVSHQKLKLP